MAQSSGSCAQTVGLIELKLGVMMHHALMHLFQWFMMGIVSPISQSEQYKVRNRRTAISGKNRHGPYVYPRNEHGYEYAVANGRASLVSDNTYCVRFGRMTDR